MIRAVRYYITDHQHAAIAIGASSGIGRVVIERLQAGYDYIACSDVETGETDWDDEGVHELAVDVRDPDVVADAVMAVESVADVVVLVNNTGTLRAVSPAGLGPDEWDRVLDMGFKGQYAVARAVAPGMAERGEGATVNVSSVADLLFKRTGMSEEVVDMTVFLCDDASYVAGTVLTVDGGSMLR